MNDDKTKDLLVLGHLLLLLAMSMMFDIFFHVLYYDAKGEMFRKVLFCNEAKWVGVYM